MSLEQIVSPISAVANLLFGEPVIRTLPLEVGARVQLIGGDHAGQEAFIQNIRVSPYWVEEKQGVTRVFVYPCDWDRGARWTDWVLVEELEVIG